MKQPKIGLVGAGQIGGTLAHLVLLRHLGDVALFDIAPGLAEGKALDLSQSAGLEGWPHRAIGGDDPKVLESCDVVIVTAGFPRVPGMSRSDLLQKNAAVIHECGRFIQEHAPQAFVIVVTNPLDAMVWVMKSATGFPPERVVGMAGILDSARFCTFLAEALMVPANQIHTLVLGGHGDLMVPLVRYTTVAGMPLLEWIQKGLLSQAKLDALIERTRQGGGEIVALLKHGSAYYTPATATLQMVESFLLDQKRLLPCAAWLNGAYGMKDIYAGVPVIIGAKGVEKIWELNLVATEKAAFEASVKSVRDLIAQVK